MDAQQQQQQQEAQRKRKEKMAKQREEFKRIMETKTKSNDPWEISELSVAQGVLHTRCLMLDQILKYFYQKLFKKPITLDPLSNRRTIEKYYKQFTQAINQRQQQRIAQQQQQIQQQQIQMQQYQQTSAKQDIDDEYRPEAEGRKSGGKGKSKSKKNYHTKRKRRDMSGPSPEGKSSSKRKRKRKNDSTYEEMDGDTSEEEGYDVGADSNDVNYAFWKYVDEHFIPVHNNPSKMSLLEPHTITEEDMKIPEVGKHYRQRWQEEEEKYDYDAVASIPTPGKRGRPSFSSLAKQQAKQEELQQATMAARTPATYFFQNEKLPSHFIDVNVSGDMLDSKSLSVRLLHSVVEERPVKFSRKKSRFRVNRTTSTPTTPIVPVASSSDRILSPQHEIQVCNADFKSNTLKETDEKILHELRMLGIIEQQDYQGKVGDAAYDYYNKDDVLVRIKELQEALKKQIEVINGHRQIIKKQVIQAIPKEEALEKQRKEDTTFFKMYEAKYGDPRKAAAATK